MEQHLAEIKPKQVHILYTVLYCIRTRFKFTVNIQTAHLHPSSLDLIHLHPSSPDLIHLHTSSPDLIHLHPSSLDLIHLHTSSPDLIHLHTSSPDPAPEYSYVRLDNFNAFAIHYTVLYCKASQTTHAHCGSPLQS